MDSYYHDDNLLNSVYNLFAAGTDTTGTTIRWGLLLMAKYPHIQGGQTIDPDDRHEQTSDIFSSMGNSRIIEECDS